MSTCAAADMLQILLCSGRRIISGKGGLFPLTYRAAFVKSVIMTFVKCLRGKNWMAGI